MRYCHFPFRHIYVDFMGQIRLCGWNNGAPVGYITDGLEKVWHSEAANEVRRAILDGSFSRCRKNVCPHIMNNTLPEIEASTLENLTYPFPDHFSLCYDYICNLACPSCRKDFIYGSPRAQEFFNNVYAELKPHLNDLLFLDIGGHGDPIFSKHSLHLLENLRPERANAQIIIETNGTLFTPAIWKKIEHLGAFNLTVIVSVESLNPYVYAKLRRGGNFDALHKNLRFMSELRQKGLIKKLNAVMVVQELNFMEMPLFAKYCTDLHFDGVDFENLYSWGTFTEKEYFFKNLLNPSHPQNEFFKELLAEVKKDKRVRCWAGDTNRNASRCVVIGASQCAVSEITPEDTVDAHAKFSTLADAIYNREYIFVQKDGMYHGMLMYGDFQKQMGYAQCSSQSAEELCNKGYTVISDKSISDIFAEKETFINSCQYVFPIVYNGKLRAKLLIEKS